MRRPQVIPLFVFVLLLAHGSIAAGDALQGNPFTDPDVVLPMEDGWRHQPVLHERGIDLVERVEADRLVEYLLNLGERLQEEYGLVPAAALRRAGWQFKGNELIGEPMQDMP